jgi:hypothetical protein
VETGTAAHLSGFPHTHANGDTQVGGDICWAACSSFVRLRGFGANTIDAVPTDEHPALCRAIIEAQACSTLSVSFPARRLCVPVSIALHFLQCR